MGQKFIDHPGPGEYDPALAVGNIPGAAVSTQAKNVQVRHEGLGPGMYNTHGTTMHRTTHNVTGPDAAMRAQGKLVVVEPPNIGGGAGGGITGTRSRLGYSTGGSGANALASDSALWEEDRKRREARSSAVAKAAKKGWAAIQDTPDRTGIAVSCTPAAPLAAANAASAGDRSPAATEVPLPAVEAGKDPPPDMAMTPSDAVEAPLEAVSITVAPEEVQEAPAEAEPPNAEAD